VLTTDNQSKFQPSVVTDVNANVPVAPRTTKVISPDLAVLLNKSIIARPLMEVKVSDIHIKNTEYAYRWVNRDGMGGRFYMQRKSQGFTNATNDDVEVLGGDAVCKDGEIRAGDCVLMKIQADRYDAAIKWNMEKANRFANARGMQQTGASSDVFADDQPRRASVSEEPFNRSGKVQTYIPTNADALVNDSILSGRAEKTRATVDALRTAANEV